MDWSAVDMTIEGLKNHYRNDDFTPEQLLDFLQTKADSFSDKNIWITRLDEKQSQGYLAWLKGKSPDDLPLYGVPFAIKDNIDLAGVPTTAACQEFAYTPEENAFVVQQLLDAGAIPMGKTNLDQFATGLVGTRSPEPWGVCHNAFDDQFISGGSSSGSAVAVALGLASFSLGTDTAGSGRIPAAMNNLVGLKPTKGLLSTRGVVPACRSLDVVSIFALDGFDAGKVFDIACQYDNQDSYARKNPFSNSARFKGLASGPVRLGVPQSDQLAFFGDQQVAGKFDQALKRWQQMGAELVEINLGPYIEAARLLYEGPWVAERYIAARTLLDSQPEALHPVVRQIIAPGEKLSAVSAFESQYRLQGLKNLADRQMANVDLIITPTLGRQYLIDELLADPITLNSNLGYYTNFMNLLDYSAVAVPSGFTERGIPTGFTLVAEKFQDQKLLAWASAWQLQNPLSPGKTGLRPKFADLPTFSQTSNIDVVVCGAHMEGLPLNWQITERGGQLVERTHSANCYQLYALPDGKRPAMVKHQLGKTIEVEVWSMPAAEFGSFVAGIPAPLGIGKVQLADGRQVSGFICEPSGVEGAVEITDFGGWRNFLQSKL